MWTEDDSPRGDLLGTLQFVNLLCDTGVGRCRSLAQLLRGFCRRRVWGPGEVSRVLGQRLLHKPRGGGGRDNLSVVLRTAAQSVCSGRFQRGGRCPDLGSCARRKGRFALAARSKKSPWQRCFQMFSRNSILPTSCLVPPDTCCAKCRCQLVSSCFSSYFPLSAYD